MRELRQLTAGGGGDNHIAQAGAALGSISLLSPVRGRPGRSQPQASSRSGMLCHWLRPATPEQYLPPCPAIFT